MNKIEKETKSKLINIIYDWYHSQDGSEDSKPIPTDEIYQVFKDLMNEFGEYCHTRYKGFEATEPNVYVYEYDSEVICMIDDFLKDKKL